MHLVSRGALGLRRRFRLHNDCLGHSGSPAFRRPSSYLARSSGRRHRNMCFISETRSAGSIWRRRAKALWARSSRPASALLAAAMRAAPAQLGCCRSPLSAHEQAFVIAAGGQMSAAHYGVREECEWIEWAEAHGTRCAFDYDLGFTKVRVDPTTQQPACCQVRIEDESVVDESGSILESSPTTNASANPPLLSAIASSLPNSTACRASRAVSAP
jgi:hypothetical protein